jgi:hypothetical protein
MTFWPNKFNSKYLSDDKKRSGGKILKKMLDWISKIKIGSVNSKMANSIENEILLLLF